MTIADTDLQQLKDLIVTGNAAIQNQIADLKLDTQKKISELALDNQRQISETRKQISDLSQDMHKQMSDLSQDTHKQISDLTQELRLGFAHADTKIIELTANSNTKFAELGGKINVLEERTKLGFWGFIGRAAIIGIIGLIAGYAVRYLLPGKIAPTGLKAQPEAAIGNAQLRSRSVHLVDSNDL